MKKYLLGIFALALAIGFSAFKHPGVRDSEKKPKALLHWYLFDEINNEIGTPINGGSLIDMDTYTGGDRPACEKVVNRNCARGYTEPQEEGEEPTIEESDFLSEP